MVLSHFAIKPPAAIRFGASLFLAALVGLTLGCGAAPEVENSPPATVKWNVAARTTLDEYTELVGTTTPLPNHMYRISARVEGVVVSVLKGPNGQAVAEGDKVSEGAVVAQLDTTAVTNSIAKSEQDQQQALSDKMTAQNEVDRARREYDRLDKLAKEDERRAREDPKYIPLVSRLQLESVATDLKNWEAKLKAASAQVVGKEKDLEALRLQLKLHTLMAPLNGRLGLVQVVPGQVLSVGTPVADVIDIDDEIDVLCYVAGSQVQKLEVGQEATTGGVDEDGGASGTIVFIADQAVPETGNFAVRVRFSNKEKHLRANRIVRVTVTTKTAPECLSLPESAVQEDAEPPTVVAVQEEKRVENGKEETVYVARRLAVTIGVRDRKNNAVQILSLSDPEKEEEKRKPVPPIKGTNFVTEGGQGLQTGDLLKQDKDEE